MIVNAISLNGTTCRRLFTRTNGSVTASRARAALSSLFRWAHPHARGRIFRPVGPGHGVDRGRQNGLLLPGVRAAFASAAIASSRQRYAVTPPRRSRHCHVTALKRRAQAMTRMILASRRSSTARRGTRHEHDHHRKIVRHVQDPARSEPVTSHLHGHQRRSRAHCEPARAAVQSARGVIDL
jgi:hypothetical protein